MAQGRGSGETPPRVKELLKRAVESSSQSAVSKESGLPIGSINRYLSGHGEPTKETLEKLAKYFNVSSGWLLGSMVISGVIYGDESRKPTEKESSEFYIYERAFKELKTKINYFKKDLDQVLESPKGVYQIMKLAEISNHISEARGLFDEKEYSEQSIFLYEAEQKLKEKYGEKIISDLDSSFTAQAIFGGKIILH